MIKEYIVFITSLRKEKGLSQAKIAKVLGISRTSYLDVEKGKRELSVSELEKLANIFGLSVEQVLSGKPQNYEKYKEMIMAFLRMGESVKKTKLAKLVYLSDFAWFYSHLKSMSGMQYRKIAYGPVPDAYFRAIDELEEEGKVVIDRKHADGKEMLIIKESESNKKQKLTTISDDELVLIKDIYKKWESKKTAEIVNFTHNQLPYLMADDNAIVSYALITQEDPHELY